MISNQIETFDDFLRDSFADEVYFRELRLSAEEADHVRKKYPKASVKKCLTSEFSDGNCWYEINLLPVSPAANDRAALQEENLRLKEELEALKKSILSVK